jgi:1-phosphofructokinase family hexose kinase
MILCVTLNPCLDKTLTVPSWKPGENIRGIRVREVVGGKGNNVARALMRLGREARPATFFGGAVGEHCDRLLREEDQLDPLVTKTASPTRVILTVRTEESAEQTAFFDPDPAITSEEAEALYHRVEGALAVGGVEALTLSGSSPSPATHESYSELIGLARARRVPVFLDAYGPALEAVWGFWPDVIQLNAREAGMHLGKPDPNERELLGLLERWARRGVVQGMITNGEKPAVARIRNQDFRVSPPQIEVVNPIGSGDCLLAGTVEAWLAGSDPEAALRFAFACAVANAQVWNAGAIDRNEVERLESRITIEPLSGR